MTQYEAIGRRHSVRRFQMTAIDPHIMKQINCFIQTLAPLHPQAAYRIAVVEAYNTQKHVFKGMFLVQAPYYLVLSAKDHPFAAVNAGYCDGSSWFYIWYQRALLHVILEMQSQSQILTSISRCIVVAVWKGGGHAVKKPASRKN